MGLQNILIKKKKNLDDMLIQRVVLAKGHLRKTSTVVKILTWHSSELD